MVWVESRHSLELKVETDDSELHLKCRRRNRAVEWKRILCEGAKEKWKSQTLGPTSHLCRPRSSH